MSDSRPETQAKTMTAQRAMNGIVRGLLRTPLVSRGIGRRLVTLYITGRKSGRHYVIPVAYTRQGDQLLIGTPFAWGRNLRTGDPVPIRLKGRRRQADVTVLTDEPGVTAAYAVMCRDNRAFASFNKIGLDAAGNPAADDLHRAWTGGARAFRLTPRR
jgi:hypothetical protein